MPPSAAANAAPRVASIDVLRGAVMVVMALDHVRDFFTDVPFAPEDLAHTYPALFYTRWVTHFCAPLFFFLAGVGAYLLYHRRGTLDAASRFLWTRGLWLVLLELTVIDFSWTFVAPWGMAGVIWTLGWSMVILAPVIRLPIRWVAGVSIAVIALHDLADRIPPSAFGRAGWLWSILHVKGGAMVPLLDHPFFVLFPLIPWVAVMSAGFAFGYVVTLDRAARRRWMLGVGWASVLAFVLLRALNGYGNPAGWHGQSSPAMSVVAFLDTEKYPPSLDFLLMTLGPSLILLSWLDGGAARLFGPIAVFGRVPLFFYVVHLYVIHIGAIIVALVCHQPVEWLSHGAIFFNETPPGYGHGLVFIYACWTTIVVALYWPCRWFSRLKDRRHDWWLSYL